MKKLKSTSTSRAGSNRSFALLHTLGVTAIAAGLLAACSSDSQTPKVPPPDAPVDRANDLLGEDLPKDLVTCNANKRSYVVGATVPMPGDCPTTCKCQMDGTLGQCVGSCGPEGGPPPDINSGLVVACTKSGKVYAAGEVVPQGDSCGGSCVCLANGTIGRCVGGCVDGGPDLGPDTGPDSKLDQALDIPADTGPEAGPPDTACAIGAACSLAGGARGLCVAGVCKTCAGAQDDATCVSVYGAGAICAGGQCVAGTCHDSRVCTGNRVCDSTYNCKGCTADSQCQNDAVYGNRYVCFANGQCALGDCRTSTDCQSKKLCSAATRTCNTCTTDAQCQADAIYGLTSVCVAGQCLPGNCTSSTDCRASGRVCPAIKICSECTTDTQCKNDAAYGANTICVSGQCVTGTCNTSSQCPNGRTCNTAQHVCVACSNDKQCKDDASYGQHSICLAGACIVGDCHDASSDCSSGRICGSSVPHACGDCTTDSQCRQDARYQTGYICVANLCVRGDCHDTSNECTASKAGLVCGAKSPHACGACSEDDQCKSDAKYGANTMCVKTAGLATTGQCASNRCTDNGRACSANADDVCCGNKCVAGSCCGDADCRANPIYGSSYFCRNNTCSRCDGVTGNAYVVDPVAGNDTTATGSGTASSTAMAGCSFRTLTRALQAIGDTPSAGTTITIVGRAGATTSLFTTAAAGDTTPTETLPFRVPANVTIATKTGPVKLTLAANQVGFILLGNQSRLMPVANATLTIDGANHASASGIRVEAGNGTASIARVTVTNTGDDGIQVVSGTAEIRAGVNVSGAGTATSRQSGLLVSGGKANIRVDTNEASTVFESNTESGIAVSGAGVLNINGVTATGGLRTVVARNNANSNVNFAQTPAGDTTVSVIDGLYAWASTQGDGMVINAGSKIKVRNSVFLANTGNGIRIVTAGTNNALATIDLGLTGTAAGNAGHNLLQAQAGENFNGGAGLCVALGAGAGAQTLNAAGNQFAGLNCSVANPGAPLLTSTNCTGRVDLGVAQPTGTTVSVTVNNCTK